MKKIKTLLFFSAIALRAQSQDIIVKKDKIEVKAKVESVNDNVIRYKKYERLDGPIYAIKKTDVFVILYENGKKDYMESKPVLTTNNTTNNNYAASNYVAISNSVNPNSVIPQNPTNSSTAAHQRNSMALLFAKQSNSPRIFSYVDNTDVPNMFDDNSFGNNTLSIDENGGGILNAIKEQKVVQKMLKSIFYNSSENKFSLDMMFSRGEYTATDLEFMVANDTKRKDAALKDLGEGLMKNIYFQVYDVKTYQEVKAEMSSEYKSDAVQALNDTKMNVMSGIAYLYKVDIAKLLDNNEFWDLIDLENNDYNKRNNFDNFDFPVKLVSTYNFNSTASRTKSIALSFLASLSKTPTYGNDNLKSEKELVTELLNKSINLSTEKLCKTLTNFEINRGVFTVKPITIKLGRKEGLKVNDLYEIKEKAIDNYGREVIKHIAWIRAKTVANNKQKATGKTQPSTFYFVSGGNVQKGMTAKYVPDKRITMGLNYGFGKGVLGGIFLNFELLSKKSKGFRWGLNMGGFSNKVEQTLQNKSTKKENFYQESNLGLELYMSKTLNVGKIDIIPKFGMYYFDLKDIKYTDAEHNKIVGFTTGVKLAYNVGKFMSFNLGYNYGIYLFENNSGAIYSNSKVSYGSSNITIGATLLGF